MLIGKKSIFSRSCHCKEGQRPEEAILQTIYIMRLLRSKALAMTCLFLLMILLCQLEASGEEMWELLFQPRQRVVRSIGSYEGKLFIGTGNGVLVSEDNGKTWNDFGSNKLLKDSSGNTLVNWIYINEENKEIYIATSFGAYSSSINEPNWCKIFESTKSGVEQLNSIIDDGTDLLDESIDLSDIEADDNNLLNGQINSISIDDKKIYLSTDDGLWACTNNQENSCQRMNEGLVPDSDSGNFLVNYVLKSNNNLFLASSNGIYIFDNGNLTWQKTINGIEKLPGGKINARYLFEDKEQSLWAVCGCGVYKSRNHGQYWEKKSAGLRANADGFQGAFYLFESGSDLYLASESGVYLFDKEKENWQDITNGIRTKGSTKNVYFLDEFQENVYAATDEGLFVLKNLKQDASNKFVLKGKVETGFADLEELEPSVVEVQKQALKFASLPTSNDYKRYRLQARLRNLVPVVNFDLNRTGTNTNYYQFQNGISTDTSLSNDYNADNTKRFQYDGRSYKQLSAQWNTNQLIYDDEIWRILNQARLTANIKENLLDDVTRIYYQRRKSQLANLRTIPRDAEAKFMKEIEVAELTGQLDSRTGGWFSNELARRKGLRVRR